VVRCWARADQRPRSPGSAPPWTGCGCGSGGARGAVRDPEPGPRPPGPRPGPGSAARRRVSGRPRSGCASRLTVIR
jgi:hypothetical protein